MNDNAYVLLALTPGFSFNWANDFTTPPPLDTPIGEGQRDQLYGASYQTLRAIELQSYISSILSARPIGSKISVRLINSTHPGVQP